MTPDTAALIERAEALAVEASEIYLGAPDFGILADLASVIAALVAALQDPGGTAATGDGVRAKLEALRTVSDKATPGPWEYGDRYRVAGEMPEAFGAGRCAYCGKLGEPIWKGRRDINGKQMPAHVHLTDNVFEGGVMAYHGNGKPISVVVETSEYGLMHPDDGAFIVAAVNLVRELLSAPPAALQDSKDSATQDKTDDEALHREWLVVTGINEDGEEIGLLVSDAPSAEFRAKNPDVKVHRRRPASGWEEVQ